VRSHRRLPISDSYTVEGGSREVYVGERTARLYLTFRLRYTYNVYTIYNTFCAFAEQLLPHLSTSTQLNLTHNTIMSAVLTMQIIHALFPSKNNTSSSHSSSDADTVIPTIHVQPAEDMEMRPLLRTLSRQSAVRHRRSSSASSKRSVQDATMMPRVGLGVDSR
jgi:hypothetical protein